jgi:hypothetical protein
VTTGLPHPDWPKNPPIFLRRAAGQNMNCDKPIKSHSLPNCNMRIPRSPSHEVTTLTRHRYGRPTAARGKQPGFVRKSEGEMPRKRMDKHGRGRQFAALPFTHREDETLVMLVISRETGRWVLPKGWAEKGLTGSELAAKEAFEEAGVVGHAAEKPVG